MSPSILGRQVAAYFQQFPERRYSAGETIIQADTPAPLPIFYLDDGLVGEYDLTASGNRVMCNMFKPGAFFPMSNALNRQPSKYFFEALAATRVRVAPATQVLAWLEQEPQVALDLLARVYRGTDGLIGRMIRLMSGTAASRVAFELMVMAERLGEPAENGALFIKVTEAQLAAQTGLARETVSRELAVLKRDGAVKLARGGIEVKLGLLSL
ncbi:MAG TPA: Crp/Fnr family transcriptional regulator [Candidatus Saccharimonadia bacterium]